MKKSIASVIILITLIHILIAPKTLKAESYIPAQDTIVGYFDFDQLQVLPYRSWFDYEFNSYKVDTITLNQIDMAVLKKVKIIVIIGTWCSDSQRETPRLVKIFNYLDYNTKDVIAIGVNRKKKAPYTEVDELNIEYVPTIIFQLDGEEIGRIIESPEESLEKDMLKIISSI